MVSPYEMTGHGGMMFIHADGFTYEVDTRCLNEITISTNDLGWSTKVYVKIVGGNDMAGTEFVCRVSWDVGGERPTCEYIEQEIAACIASRVVAKEIYGAI